jgi:uncharacterized protein (DUF169 family)
MYALEGERVIKALGLRHGIIGVKFIWLREEYEKCPAKPLKGKITVCAMAKKAMDGIWFKSKGENFGCLFGSYAIGINKPDLMDACGQSVAQCGLYEDYGISRQIMEGMRYLDHKVYGLEMAPLKEMREADIVIIMAEAYQIMRIMQGYAYKQGNPRNLCSVGNQAVCSDLIAKPFASHDINISFMCKGARLFTQCGDGEMAVAVPAGLFGILAEGILRTVNPVLNEGQKKELLNRLEKPDELGFLIDASWNYSTKLREFLNLKERSLSGHE